MTMKNEIEANTEATELPDDGSTADTAHLDAITIDEPEGGEEGGTAPAPAMPVTADGFLTADAFREGLGKALLLSGHVTGLRTLLQGPEQDTWPDAAAAIYDTIMDTPALHFMIRPGGKWMMRAAAVAAWSVPVAMGCASELQSRNRPPQSQPLDPREDGPMAWAPKAANA